MKNRTHGFYRLTDEELAWFASFGEAEGIARPDVVCAIRELITGKSYEMAARSAGRHGREWLRQNINKLRRKALMRQRWLKLQML